MTAATHNDVVKMIPEVQDHAIVEILAAEATVGEIEAALAALAGEDEALIEFEQRKGDRIHRLIGILRASQIEVDEDRAP
jgi:hypothetical protein